MKKSLQILLLIITVTACKNANIPEKEITPCNILVNGVYQYPTKKPDTGLTQDEIKEYWDIPKDVLTCISTKGLILSCYNTYAAILITASNGYQQGYSLVKYNCRGFGELEKREDFGSAFIEYYKSIELPHTIDYGLFTLETAMAQENVLKQLTREQQIELLNLCLKYHIERRSIFNHAEIHYEGTPIIMGRLMIVDEMQQFIQSAKRNDDISRFLEGLYTYKLSLASADTIVNYAAIYLNKLKSTNL